MKNRMAVGLPEVKDGPHCEVHAIGKQARKTFPTVKSRRTTACLQLVHIDLCGPMSVDSFGCNKFFLLFVDDFSMKCWVYFLKAKGEAFEHFRRFHVLVKRETGRKLKVLRSNRGDEFMSRVFNGYCEGLGIRRKFTTPYTP